MTKLALILLAVSFLGTSQTPEGQPAFEVASVNLSPPQGSAIKDDCSRIAPNPDPVLFHTRKKSLKALIQCAYSLEDYQLSGGPSWSDSTLYDIEAKPLAPATHEQKLSMLQKLLADRFDLAVHRTTQPQPFGVLTLSKGGPKLGPQFHIFQEGEAPVVLPQSEAPRRFRPATIKDWATELWYLMVHAGLGPKDMPPLADQTGLSGVYAITLTFQQQPSYEEWVAILDSQMGLKLSLRKVPTEVVVIDGANKPSANQ